MVVRAVADVGASRAWATTEVVGGKEEDRPVVGASIGVLVVVAELGTIVGSSSDGSTFFAWATTEAEGGKEGDRPVVGASVGVLVVVAEFGTIVGSSSDGSTFFWKRHCCIGLVTAPVDDREALFLGVVDPSA